MDDEVAAAALLLTLEGRAVGEAVGLAAELRAHQGNTRQKSGPKGDSTNDCNTRDQSGSLPRAGFMQDLGLNLNNNISIVKYKMFLHLGATLNQDE